MGTFFGDKTEKAIRLIYSGLNRRDFAAGFELLREAVNEGDSDAKFFLARCYFGEEFVWEDAGLLEDYLQGRKLIKAGMREGSVVAVLGARRAGIGSPFSVFSKEPFVSEEEAYDRVLDMALRGEAFCQYMIGNAHFWHDVRYIKNLPDTDAELVMKSIPWYEKAVNAGLHWCASNLHTIYASGRDGVPADTEKKSELLERLAKMGNPRFMAWWADELHERGEYDEAFRLALRAAENDSTYAMNILGNWYNAGEGVDKDIKRAIEYYEKSAERGNAGAQAALGRRLFFGAGVEKDYSRSFYWLEKAAKSGRSPLAYRMLGLCFFYGCGAPQDYEKAGRLFEKGVEESEYDGLFEMGRIYAEGLGTPRNIELGVEYFMAAARLDHPNAVNELARYKKTLFGGWKQR
jgi:TPR repeat protein